MAVRRTTIELDDDLLRQAKVALGSTTTRATVEEALRRAVEGVTSERERRRAAQTAILASIGDNVDLDVLRSGVMWR